QPSPRRPAAYSACTSSVKCSARNACTSARSRSSSAVNEKFILILLVTDLVLALACVLSSQLRRGRPFQLEFVMFEPGAASPGALQAVLYVDMQSAEAFDFQLYAIAILEWIETTVVRTG